jgi:hypothetical protein
MATTKHGMHFAATLLCSLLLFGASSVAQQTPSNAGPMGEPSPVKKAKPKKLWTNENIGEIRTSADVYQDRKLEADNAQKQQTAQPTTSPGQNDAGASAAGLTIPKTEEEIEAAINLRKDWLADSRTILENTRQRLAATIDPVLRETLEEKAKLVEQDIATSTNEIQALEKARSKLRAEKKTQP